MKHTIIIGDKDKDYSMGNSLYPVIITLPVHMRLINVVNSNRNTFTVTMGELLFKLLELTPPTDDLWCEIIITDDFIKRVEREFLDASTGDNGQLFVRTMSLGADLLWIMNWCKWAMSVTDSPRLVYK